MQTCIRILALCFCASLSSLHAQLPSSYVALASGNTSRPEAVGTVAGELAVDRSGAATYSVPIAISPGTGGMEPKLSLNYSSQSGNGIAGFGWSLSGVSVITRGGQTLAVDNKIHGMDFTLEDRYYLDGQRLVALAPGANGAAGTEYRTENESFSRIVSYGSMGNGPEWFKVWTKDGRILEFGASDDSRRQVSGRSEMISWSVNKISDMAGNYMTFSYIQDVSAGTMTLSRIDYTGHADSPLVAPYASVRFEYENRTDTAFAYTARAKLAQNVRLKYIRAYYGETVVRRYTLNYLERPVTGRSMLTSVTLTGMDGKAYPPLTFDYSNPANGWTQASGAITDIPNVIASPAEYQRSDGFCDLNGDGLPDNVGIQGAWLNTPSGWVLADGSNGKPDYGTTAAGVRFVDINGDGLTDLADIYSNPGYVSINDGSRFTLSSAWSLPPQPAFPIQSYIVGGWSQYWQLLCWARVSPRYIDLNGDGRLDYVGQLQISVEEWDPQEGSFTDRDLYAVEIYLNRGSGGGVSGTAWEPNTSFVYQSVVGDDPLKSSIITDYNGDGLPDLMEGGGPLTPDFWPTTLLTRRNLGNGFDYYSGGLGLAGIPLALQHRDFFGLHSYDLGETVDLNGDGLVDYVCRGFGRYDAAAINTGPGIVNAPEYQVPFDISNYSFPPIMGSIPHKLSQGVSFFDINNDGHVDLIKSIDGVRTILLGTGRGWSSQSESAYSTMRAMQQTGSAPGLPGQLQSTSTGTDFVDINGDGAVDQVWNDGTTKGALLNKRVNPDRLISITTGLGLTTTITYAPLTERDPSTGAFTVYQKGTDSTPGRANLISSRHVVKAVDHDDAVGGQYRMEYRYGGWRSERLRGDLGFETMTTYDTRTGISSTATYRQDYPFVGLVSGSVTKTSDGQKLTESSVTYSEGALSWSGTHFVYPYSSTGKSWDLNGSFITSTRTTNSFDAYGNLTAADVQTLDAAGNSDGYSNSTTNTYASAIDAPSTGSSRWLLGLLGSTTTTAIGPNLGSGIPTSITRTSDFEYNSSTGFLTKVIVEPGSASDPANLTLTTTYTHDDFGHQRTVTVSGGGMDSRTTTTFYDSQGRFPQTTINTLNQGESYVYDPYFGGMTSLTGPNGLTTSWLYDGMGRKVLETRPSSDSAVPNTTAVNYRWCNSSAPSRSVYQIETVTTGAAPSIALYDKAGRAIYAFGINGGLTGTPCVVGTGTIYDNMGRPYRTSLPFYYTGGEPSLTDATHTYYDVLNRPTTIQNADDPNSGSTPVYRVSTVTYSGRETTSTNAKNQTSVSRKNSQGWIVETFSNYNGAGSERGHVAFMHDPLGQVCVSTVYRDGDASSVSTTLEYDLRGRKKDMIDPDMGYWEYHYNAVDEIISQTDGKRRPSSFTYDALGRLKTRTEDEGTTTWNYDTAPHGIGKLASVSASADRGKTYSETYSYDTLGRPDIVTRTINGAAYSQGQTYDVYSRPEFTTYPGSYRVGNRYNTLGFLTEVYDARSSSNTLQGDVPAGYVYWRADGYSLMGLVNASTLGNGVTHDRIISDITGRLRALTSGAGATLGVQNILYSHDELGNVTRRYDTTTGRDEGFQYDGLNRLKHSDVNGGSPIDVTYDALGNIKTKSNAGTYVYGERGYGPHAVTTVSGGPAASADFVYDADGNLAWDGQRSITYTSYNQVKTITKNGRKTEFWFGVGHDRVYQEDAGGSKTTYVGSLFEIVDTGGFVENKHYIFTPAGRVAMRTSRSGGTYQVRFLHQDALGSITAVTDELGNVEQRFTFDAWGKRTQTVNTHVGSGGAVTRGFTDHEHLDDFGIIHMNGRVYDPILGRFLSADPFVQDPGYSQSYNRYSYIMNNPVNGTDPTGFIAWGGWMGVLSNVWNWLSGGQTPPTQEESDRQAQFDQEHAEELATTLSEIASVFNSSLLNAASVGAAFASAVTGVSAGAGSSSTTGGSNGYMDAAGIKLWNDYQIYKAQQEGRAIVILDPIEGSIVFRPRVGPTGVDRFFDGMTRAFLGVTGPNLAAPITKSFWRNLYASGRAIGDITINQTTWASHPETLKFVSNIYGYASTDTAGFIGQSLGTLIIARASLGKLGGIKDPWIRTPESLQDQMTLDAAKQGAGRKIIDNLGDPDYLGMEKWEYKVKSSEGSDSVVHYVRDPQTGKLMDFKFKKQSLDQPTPRQSTPEPSVGDGRN